MRFLDLVDDDVGDTEGGDKMVDAIEKMDHVEELAL